MYKVPGTGVGVGTGVGALAVTGADVTWWIVAGIVLLFVGAFLLHSARKKRRPIPVETDRTEPADEVRLGLPPRPGGPPGLPERGQR